MGLGELLAEPGTSEMDLGPLGASWVDLLWGPGLHGDTPDGAGISGAHLAGPGTTWRHLGLFRGVQGLVRMWGHPGWASGDKGQGFMGTLGPVGDILVAQGRGGIF